MAARAMANFGLSELRLVAPREGWPHPAAEGPSAGALHVLTSACVFPTVAAAIADLGYVLATTARARGQMKRAFGPDEGLGEIARRAAAGQATGILFGRERSGLDNDEVSLADAILTFPVDPAFPSVNLAGAVLLTGFSWSRATAVPMPAEFVGQPISPPASRESVVSLFEAIESELDKAGHYPPDKRDIMVRNMRDMFHRMALTEQDVRTWRGAIRALSAARARRKA